MCQIHSWSWYKVDLLTQGKIYDIWLCVQASAFLSFDKIILCLAHEFITMLWCVCTFMNSVWPWPLTSISKLYFHHGFQSGKMSFLFDIGIPNFGIFVYYHETTLCTFLTLVWLWPLIYMWVAGGILSEFYSQFLSCYILGAALSLQYKCARISPDTDVLYYYIEKKN